MFFTSINESGRAFTSIMDLISDAEACAISLFLPFDCQPNYPKSRRFRKISKSVSPNSFIKSEAEEVVSSETVRSFPSSVILSRDAPIVSRVVIAVVSRKNLLRLHSTKLVTQNLHIRWSSYHNNVYIKYIGLSTLIINNN